MQKKAKFALNEWLKHRGLKLSEEDKTKIVHLSSGSDFPEFLRGHYGFLDSNWMETVNKTVKSVQKLRGAAKTKEWLN